MHPFLLDRQTISVVACTLWLGYGLTGCGFSNRPVEPLKPPPPPAEVRADIPEQGAEPVILEPTTRKTPALETIKPSSTKLAVKVIEPDVETVSIDGQEYQVPVQWQGRKVVFEPFPMSELTAIPPEFTKNGAAIYLKKEAVAALVAMGKKAQEDNVSLQVNSGFRSTRYQRVIFKRMMAQGRSFEDVVRFVAPPGYSEHLLGTVVDFAPGNWRFADTPEYRWLREHAAAFGFSETYPENNPEKIPWESWHWKWSDLEPLPAD